MTKSQMEKEATVSYNLKNGINIHLNRWLNSPIPTVPNIIVHFSDNEDNYTLQTFFCEEL